MPAETHGLAAGSPAARIQALDPHGTARFTLRAWPGSRGYWVLEQGGTAVGVIKQTSWETSVRSSDEAWSVAVRRHGRLGWRLDFRRSGEREPVVRYYPSTLLPGGRLVSAGGARFRVRCPVLRDDWRLTAAGSEVARIAFREHGTVTAFRKHVAFSGTAAREPLLPGLLLAAGMAIIVHDAQPRPWMTS